MKKLVNILFATAVAAFALVSCQKNMQEENVSQKETVEAPAIHFYATDIATKTVFGDVVSKQYPTLWTTNKGIKISYNKKTSVEATVTPKDGNAKADFTPASEITDAGTGTNVFYALSPSTAQAANISGSYYSWRFTVPTSQTPLDASVDEDAQVLYAKYDAGATFPTAVPFSFRHLTAYGKLSFKGLALDGDETVTSITLTASENWVGEWYYYVDTKDPNTEGEIKPASASKKLTLNTDKVTDIWFACAPVDLSDGGTIDINVFTNKGVFVKKITFPAGKGDFAYGEIGAFMVDMSAVTRIEPDAYSVAEIRGLYAGADVAFTAMLTDALVTIVSGDNAYIQDASGAVLVYSSGHGLSVGDKLTGLITGTLTDYNGLKEIKSFTNSASKTTGNVVTPTTVALSTLVANFEDYDSEYVKVENLTVSAVSGKDITISEDDDLKIRNESGKTVLVGTKLNAVGAPGLFKTTKQVKIYSLEDDDLIVIPSEIYATDKSVAVGETISINATTNSTATISYESANVGVATVDENGVITGVSAGSTTITCSVPLAGKYTAASKEITVTVISGSGIPSPEEIDFSTLGLSNGVAYNDPFDGGHFTITFPKNGNNGKYYTNGAAIRSYGGNSFTVASTSNTISKIELTFGSGDGSNTITTDSETYEDGTWTGSASSVTFTVGGTSGNRRIQKVKVTYSE